MNPALLARLALVFGGLSFVSIGGVNALLPELRGQVVGEQWMTAQDFAHVFAIASAAPGPNSILLSLIGWRVAGLPGLIVATIAFLAPSSLLAFAVARHLAKWGDRPWVSRLRLGLAPVAVGLILGSGAAMTRLTDRTWLMGAISLSAAAFVTFTRYNPLWAIAFGAAVVAGAQRFI